MTLIEGCHRADEALIQALWTLLLQYSTKVLKWVEWEMGLTIFAVQV
jgi:hypothetical protein